MPSAPPFTERAARAAGLAAAVAALVIAARAAFGAGLDLVETPELESLVAAGRLPPIAARLPVDPLVARFGDGAVAGRPGGSIRTLIGGMRDLRVMNWYGYARLVGYDASYRLKPDILESFEVSADSRSFTLHLRPGHRWSDGAPFTAEDFRYYWQDMEENRDLSPLGPDSRLIVDGHPPEVTIVDS